MNDAQAQAKLEQIAATLRAGKPPSPKRRKRSLKIRVQQTRAVI
jgi:hypothetical protein